MPYGVEVLIVGGGPAGLSAALLLGRCRRQVLVCDAGRPRNAAALAVHGYLTRDHTPPRELRAAALAELHRYPTVEVRAIEVLTVERSDEGFSARLADGDTVAASKLVLATGVVDRLPPREGARQI
jgi:thioredoxin reductase